MRKVFCAFLTLVVASMCAEEQPALPHLHVCTVASHETQGLKQLQQSCDHNSIQLVVMGLRLPYKGNGQKLSYLKNFLQGIPDEDLVLFVDAYDVLILADTKTLVTKFLAMNARCVFSAETSLYPLNRDALGRFPPSPTKFKYLNSGSIMGYASHLRHILESIPIKEKDSDQSQLIKYYLDHQSEIVLDYLCELFIPLYQLQRSELDIDKEHKVVRCLVTGTTPCIVHGNGSGKSLYQYIYDILF